jgi:hypothetical protein
MRALILSLLFATRLFAADCAPVLTDALRYAIRGEARSLVAYDANHDGRLDIVAAADGRNELAVLHNVLLGNSTVFSNDTAIVLGHPTLELFVHGNDLIAVGPQHISVIRDANDVRTSTLTGTALAKPIVLAQLAGDGTIDIAAMTTDRNLRIFRGNADRTFTLVGSQSFAASPYRHIAAAEVTGDAHGDVIVADKTGAYVLPGNGDGTFGAKRDLLVSEDVRWVGTASIDDDTRADIVLGGWTSVARLTLLSSRDYKTPAKHTLFYGMFLDDVDGDGEIDTLGGDMILRKGAGDGTFAEGWRGSMLMNDAIVADFDGNGRKDLAVAAWQVDGVAILFDDGDGTFDGARGYDMHGNVASHIEVADLNRDGFDDVVVSSSGYATIYLGSASGALAEKQDWFAAGAVARAGDFTSDGILDLYTTSRGLLTGRGDGTFTGTSEQTSGHDSEIDVADMNGDGKLDVVGVSSSGTVSIHHGDGNGKFTTTEFSIGRRPYIVRVADVTGDGRPDILIAGTEEDQSTYTLRLLTARADGTFAPPVILRRDGSGFALAVADLDANGTTDIIVTDGYTTPKNNAIVVLRGSGNGTFTEWQRLPVAPFDSEFGSSATLTTGDFNGDGRIDIGTVTDFGYATTYVQSAARTFETASQLYATGWFAIGAGDLNGDGADDLIADGVSAFISACPAARPAHVELRVPSSSDGDVTLTAHVPGATAGHVRFTDGDHTLGIAEIADGYATLTLSDLPKARYFVQAVYSGHETLVRSVSDVVTHDVIDISPKRRAARH